MTFIKFNLSQLKYSVLSILYDSFSLFVIHVILIVITVQYFICSVIGGFIEA
jgi:hypothetical protein